MLCFYTYKKNECSNKLYTNRWKCVIFLKDIYLYIPIEITPYYGVGKLISVNFFTMNPGGDYCAK